MADSYLSESVQKARTAAKQYQALGCNVAETEVEFVVALIDRLEEALKENDELRQRIAELEKG